MCAVELLKVLIKVMQGGKPRGPGELDQQMILERQHSHLPADESQISLQENWRGGVQAHQTFFLSLVEIIYVRFVNISIYIYMVLCISW